MAGMTLSADGTDGKNWGGVIVFDVWINIVLGFTVLLLSLSGVTILNPLFEPR